MSALVKTCGVTRADEAAEIARLGADFIGVNFWPQSKRHLSPEDFLKWPVLADVKFVGVFVNPELELISRVSARLHAIQLHGDESPEFCAGLLSRNLRVIKAFQVRDEASLDRITAYPVSDVLLDAWHPGERGGIGESFPWTLAQIFKERFPDKRLWLAGGLTPGNVADAVRGVQPFAVDVASGVESGKPGVKDMEKVARFISEARGVR